MEGDTGMERTRGELGERRAVQSFGGGGGTQGRAGHSADAAGAGRAAGRGSGALRRAEAENRTEPSRAEMSLRGWALAVLAALTPAERSRPYAVLQKQNLGKEGAGGGFALCGAAGA